MKLKKVGLLSVALLSTVAFSSMAKAEKVCTTYKNYYFFSEINTHTFTVEKVDTAGENGWARSHRTYFPKLPEGAILADNYTGERVCLKKEENSQADGTCNETWTLDDYYTKYKAIMRNESANTKEFYTTGETEEDKANYTVLTEGNENYFLHGKWYEIENGVMDTNGKDRVRYNSVSNEALIGGSILPTLTSITFDFTQTYSLFAKIDRTLKQDNLSGLTPFMLSWTGGTDTDSSVLTPALYKIEYQMCEDVETYNATINYYYYKDGKPTKEFVEFDNNELNQVTRENLRDGYTEKVTSPDKKGCSIVNESGKTYETDKEVTILIDKGNFTKNVYYYCPADDEGAPVPTGDFLIYVAWAVGLGAIGYSVYYFKKMKKEEV